jgi:hypothetical protein
MKKCVIIFLTLLLVVSSFQAFGTEKNTQNSTHIKSEIIFDQCSISTHDDYISIEYTGTNDFIDQPGYPQVPIYTKVYKIPGKATNVKVNCELVEYNQQQLTGKIIPEPQTVYHDASNQYDSEPVYLEDLEIYSSDIYYPSQPFDYAIRCGLDTNGQPTTFVYVELHPVQYNPVENSLRLYSNGLIHVDYNPPIPEENTFSKDTYDLVIIAPEKFEEPLQDFVAHKNSMGVSTIIKTTESIYSEYNGRDEPEQIKYFIKDAKENWDTTYILLFGGLKSYLYAKDKDGQSYGTKAWYVPVRYANIVEGDEKSAISDLYYSDLYRYNEDSGQWEFEDWDSSGDGIFAKWYSFTQDKDILDLVPDIYVGRLPCRNRIELNIVVNKIINYESTSPDEKPWFKTFIGVSGKNFDIWKGQPDGEYLVDRAIENMTGHYDNVIRVYASNNLTGQGPIPNTEDIVEEFSKGAGYIDFEGHGNPIVWDTIEADGEYDNHDWVGGIRIPDFLKLSNGDKLPVVMVGGCHNGLFNVSMLRILLTRSNDPPTYWTEIPTPFCFCWAMIIKPGGGAIASIGATGLGPASSTQGPLSLQGEIDNCFFSVIGQQNVDTLGAGHSGAVAKYVSENAMTQRETFTATITELFGDPSLKLGGYP